jgi:hypothetical protein
MYYDSTVRENRTKYRRVCNLVLRQSDSGGTPLAAVVGESIGCADIAISRAVTCFDAARSTRYPPIIRLAGLGSAMT